MKLCQLLLETSRQGHICKLCQNDFLLSWRGVSRGGRCRFYDESYFVDQNGGGRVAKILRSRSNFLALENQTEARKTGNRIKCGSDVAYMRPWPIASIWYCIIVHRF